MRYTMKKNCLPGALFSALLIIITIMTAPLFPAKLGTLDGIFKPQMIKVFDKELFVVEGHNILIYSLENLKLKKKLGKKGEGPGEFTPDPSRTIIMTVFPNYIMAESRNKIIWFSRQGTFVKELRKTPGILQALPVKNNFLVHKILFGPGGQNYFTANIYNKDMKEIKELYRQKFFTFQQKVYVMPDPLSYCTCNNKIYLEKSPEGFLIEEYNADGDSLRRIEIPRKKREITETDRQTAYKDYIEIPFYKRMIRTQGKAYFNNYLKTLNLAYPEHFPAMRDIAVDCKHQKLYARTYNQKNQKEEFVVLNLDGKQLGTVYLPRAREADFLVRLQGDKKYYTIHDNTYYYLQFVETDEDEDWEIHAVPIKINNENEAI